MPKDDRLLDVISLHDLPPQLRLNPLIRPLILRVVACDEDLGRELKMDIKSIDDEDEVIILITGQHLLEVVENSPDFGQVLDVGVFGFFGAPVDEDGDGVAVDCGGEHETTEIVVGARCWDEEMEGLVGI